ncbi:uncharacterized protein LOC133386045 isoform X1 [Rhineura floridana]|uniref:uncharacterized protein LOC133386045 isoform X1 n=1 Tax=Rhineura floridana TaxID=261503 RepID=UPI002AC83EFD|nr:uncharacterized protein LOC133386045 isoform X1 [Rhineura floridana]
MPLPNRRRLPEHKRVQVPSSHSPAASRLASPGDTALPAATMSLGGLSPTKPATPEVQAISSQVKQQLEDRVGEIYTIFWAIAYRSQVVAGTNYFIKAGEDIHAYFQVFEQVCRDQDLEQRYWMHVLHAQENGELQELLSILPQEHADYPDFLKLVKEHFALSAEACCQRSEALHRKPKESFSALGARTVRTVEMWLAAAEATTLQQIQSVYTLELGRLLLKSNKLQLQLHGPKKVVIAVTITIALKVTDYFTFPPR